MTAHHDVETATRKDETGHRHLDALRAEGGAFDLPSILVGVVVVGVLTAGVLASIFGVIPFSQNHSAKQDIGAVTSAQGVSKAQNGVYETAAQLTARNLLPVLNPLKVDTKPTVGGGWATAAKADTGRVFLSTNTNPEPLDVTGTLTTSPASPPTVNTPTTTTTNGTLQAATYYYVLTSVTNGETTRSNEVSVTTTGTTSRITLSWTLPAGVTNVIIYRSTSPGTEGKLIQVGGSGTSWIDDGSRTPQSSTPPTSTTATVTTTINNVASALATK